MYSTFARPRVLAVLPHAIPSTIICVVKPIARLDSQGEIIADMTLEYLVTRAQVARADVVIFCRNTEPAYGQALRWAVELGKPIIYDLDDNLFDLPASDAVGNYHREPARLDQLRNYIEAAALVRVYSERLRDKLLRITRRVQKVDGPLDWSLVRTPVGRGDSLGRVRIVYATSRIKDQLADLFLGAVEQVLETYPEQVQLTLWGVRLERLSRHPSVRCLPHDPNYDRFFSRFARAGFEIGLAPLPEDDFHLCKSNNKFREYAASHVAGVYSNVPVYSGCVQHRVHGLLVENRQEAWFDAINRLIHDTELRHSIQENAYDYARAHYGQDLFCDVWLEQIQASLAAGQRPGHCMPISIPPPAPGTIDSAGSMTKFGLRLARMLLRIPRSLRVRGVRATIALGGWILNDLSILFWKRRRSG